MANAALPGNDGVTVVSGGDVKQIASDHATQWGTSQMSAKNDA